VNLPTLLLASSGPVTTATLREVLERLGVRHGDALVVHSGLLALGKIGEVREKTAFGKAFIDTLLEAIGPAGTLLLPTFSFSFCKSGVYDPAATPSEMGILTDVARTLPGARRTLHPVYSHAVFGAGTAWFLGARTDTSFGEGSIFDRMHGFSREHEGRLSFLTLGIPRPPEAVTYIHHLEWLAKVPYRHMMEFRGVVRVDGEEAPARTDFFARNDDARVEFDRDGCWKLWQDAGICRTENLGDGFACLTHEEDARRVTLEAIADKPDFLCIGGYAPPHENGE
jgi:aminoglycoside 3-N-acetyltransferase